MELMVLLPLIFTALLLIIDIAVFIKMISLVKKYKDNTVEEFANKLKPYLHISGIVSVLLAVCMILVIIIR
jgi:hypothetical protein